MFSGGAFAIPALVNSQYVQGLTTAPVSAVNLIGLNSSNLVSIDPSGVGSLFGGQVTITPGGLTISGSVGAGHGQPDAQLEVDNALGGHAAISIYQKYSASEEGAISFEANLSNAAVQQQVGIFSVFVNDVNTFNNYKTALGAHLVDSTADTTPFILFSNNAVMLAGGLTSALLWDTAPATNSVTIGRSANVVSLTVNTTALTYDPTLNGSVGGWGFGAAAIPQSYVYEEMPALTTAGGSSFYKHLVNNVNAVTIGVGTAAVVCSLLVAEPNIVLAGNTVTIAATLYVASVPTEGGRNYSIYNPTGKVNFGGLPTSAAGLSAGDLWVDTAGALNILKVV